MRCLNDSIFRVIKGDISLDESDAIVNGVNTVLLGVGAGIAPFTERQIIQEFFKKY